MATMNGVNAHICPTCGGKLSVDIERQMYECPFCGVTFDYDYFREESVLGIASQALMNNEFDSADKAYDFMLEKEPDNFEALRGKALVAMDITKIDAIGSLELYSRLDYEAAYKKIDAGISSSKPSDREYFTTMKDIVDAGREYIDEMAALEPRVAEKDKTVRILSGFERDRDTICIYASPKFTAKRSVILTAVCYLICCLIVFAGFKFATRNPYSRAEDLSRYETEDSSESGGMGIVDMISEDNEYREALKREEQRKIDYENWEKEHEDSGSSLVWIMGIMTGVFVLLALIIFLAGRTLNKEIAKIQAQVDEQEDKIRERKENIDKIKERFKQGYERLMELQPGEQEVI